MSRFQVIVLLLALHSEHAFTQSPTMEFLDLVKNGNANCGILKVLTEMKPEFKSHVSEAKAFHESGGKNAEEFKKSMLPFSSSKLFFSGYVALNENDSKYNVMSLHCGQTKHEDVKPGDSANTFVEITTDKLKKQLVKENLVPGNYFDKSIDSGKAPFTEFGVRFEDGDNEIMIQRAINTRLDELAVASVQNFYEQYKRELAKITAKAGTAKHFFFLKNEKLHIHQIFLLTGSEDQKEKKEADEKQGGW